MKKSVKFLKDIFDDDKLIWSKGKTYSILLECITQIIVDSNIEIDGKYAIVPQDEGVVFEFV